MSHFTVLVIGENPEKQLQPYHEYECTGIEDEYVVFVEAEEDLEKEYQKHKDDYTSIDEFAKDYYGYIKEGDKWGRITNPNKKWDWYVLGGRWTGYFRLKDDADGEIGEPGIMTARAKVGHADAAYKRDIDFDYMRNERANKAAKEYDKAMKIIGHLPVNKTWEQIRGKGGKDIDKKKSKYWEQPRCKAWQAAKTMEDFGWDSSPDDYLISKEQFVQNAKESAISTFAVLKESKWYEKGEMGWFGMAHNEKEQDQWNKEFYKLLNDLPDDTLLSIYDCHI